MPVEFGALLFEAVKKIVFTAISKRVVLAGESFLTRRKIESRIDDSIAQVVEQLLPFFESEHLSDQKRRVLIGNCSYELEEILKDPREIFAASLDGQKVFDRRYEKSGLPQGIRDERLEDLYALVFPQIANLICAYPPAIEQWKIEGFRDGFRRLDDIAATLGGVANKLDQLASQDSQTADVLLRRVRQSLAQRVEFQLDLTGLRGDRPDAVPLEKCFVAPELSRAGEERLVNEETKLRIGDIAEILSCFSGPSIRAIVIGSPGAGKSTWSRWLQRQQLTSESDRLAVLVRLRDLMQAAALPSQQSLIRDAAGTHLREEVDANVTRKWCESGSVTFILDGFDEVPPNRRDSVLSWIKDLGDSTESAGLILTSRPLTTDHIQQLSSNWLRWELLPFDEARITDYISKWYANAPLLADKPRDVNAEELARKWVNDFALSPLVGTPLMLATIVMVHHMDGELPKGRAKLYDRYIDGMLGIWDSRWGVPSTMDLSPALKRRMLTRLAVHLHLQNIEQLGDQDMEVQMKAILPSVGCAHLAQEVLDHLRERTGLVIGPGTWSFIHKNVGEFLVAAAIRDGDFVANDGQKLDRLRLFAERHSDRWNNVLFFWAGLTSPGDLQSFIEQVSAESASQDLVLVLSLIYDQLQPYRLTETWRSEQLLKLLETGVKVGSLGSYAGGYICGPRPEKMKLEANTLLPPHLRTPERSDLRDSLWECLRASNISWRQLEKCHSTMLFIAWSFYATSPRNEEDLRAALGQSHPGHHIPSEWLMFPATWGIHFAASVSAGVSLANFIEVLGLIKPELKGRVPLFLLGALTNMVNGDSRDEIAQSVDSILAALENVKSQELDSEWLKETTGFVGFVGDSFWSPHPIDLLKEALISLDRVALPKSYDHTLISNAREYVMSIMAIRDRLETT